MSLPSLEMRYYGLANLLAETSRRFATLSSLLPGGEDEELMERIGAALEESCEDSNVEFWGSARNGFSLSVYIDPPGDDAGCLLCGEEDETICDSCSRPICFGCQAEDTTDCAECAS